MNGNDSFHISIFKPSRDDRINVKTLKLYQSCFEICVQIAEDESPTVSNMPRSFGFGTLVSARANNQKACASLQIFLQTSILLGCLLFKIASRFKSHPMRVK